VVRRLSFISNASRLKKVEALICRICRTGGHVNRLITEPGGARKFSHRRSGDGGAFVLDRVCRGVVIAVPVQETRPIPTPCWWVTCIP